MKNRKTKIAILLGTYNGIKYIKNQIKSIQRQSITEWRLFIRDDGSTDKTLNFIRSIQDQDERIAHVIDNDAQLGVVANYSRLMEKALEWGADRIFLCDQDDIWCTEKIKIQTLLIDACEIKYGQSYPVLVHSDLELVDQQLQNVHNSFLSYQGIQHENNKPIRVLPVQNFVTGCASAFNHALLEKATPIPKGAIMHDWWIALCAATWGKIGFIEKPLIKYRQHGENEIGAKHFLHMFNPLRENLLKRWVTGRANFHGSINQAKSLMEKISEYPSEVSPESAQLINAYATCLELNRLKRISSIYSQCIHRQRFIFQILFYIRLFLSNTATQ